MIQNNNLFRCFESEVPMKTNYHTHSQRCRHAQGTEEDYVRCALDAGVSILGFSEHAPFPDHDYGYRMPYEELADHFSEVDRLAGKYASAITILKGLEIEYLPKYLPYYERLLQEDHLDYLLLGEHFFPIPDREYLFVADATDTEAYLWYARAIDEALKTGLFRMLAHPDLFAMNKLPWDKNCDATSDRIIESAVRYGVILELNANGFRRGIHEYPEGPRLMYPHIKFWQKVVGSGARVIIGSDAHEPCQVWDACMPKAYDMLKGLGIEPILTI